MKKKIMKKSLPHKRSRGSSFSSFDTKRFVLVNAEAQLHDSIKRRVGLKEKGFKLDSSHLQYFETIIAQRGWQEFCKPPKVAMITVVREFYANAFESPVLITMVRER